MRSLNVRPGVWLTRIQEALREVGVLLMAFTPLESAFSGGAGRPWAVALFFASGVLFFLSGVLIEARRGSNG